VNCFAERVSHTVHVKIIASFFPPVCDPGMLTALLSSFLLFFVVAGGGGIPSLFLSDE
jgi:hypothetical protein